MYFCVSRVCYSRYKSVKKNKSSGLKPLIGKSNSATARTFAHLRPSPRCPSGAFPLLPRAFRVSSAFRRLRALVLRSLSPSVSPCIASPLSRPLSRRPVPFQRVPLQLPCVLLLLPRLSAFSVLPRAFAMCCCAAHSHAPPCRARPPCCSPTDPVQDSRDVTQLCRWCCSAVSCVLALIRASLRCCCRTVAPSPSHPPLSPHALPDAPHAPPIQTVDCRCH